MIIEVHFTPIDLNKEIPFSIATGKTENEIFLYSQVDDNEYKFPLSIDNGLLQLKDENPFLNQ